MLGYASLLVDYRPASLARRRRVCALRWSSHVGVGVGGFGLEDPSRVARLLCVAIGCLAASRLVCEKSCQGVGRPIWVPNKQDARLTDAVVLPGGSLDALLKCDRLWFV